MLASTMQHSTHNHTPTPHGHHHAHNRNALGNQGQKRSTKKHQPGVSSGPNSVPNLVSKSSMMVVFHPAASHPRMTRDPEDAESEIRTTTTLMTHEKIRTIAVCLTNTVRLLRKEVIQPHLPVRLPCYDFVPIASPTFDNSLPQAG